jgi:hypothetical protein
MSRRYTGAILYSGWESLLYITEEATWCCCLQGVYEMTELIDIIVNMLDILVVSVVSIAVLIAATEIGSWKNK